MYEIVSSVIKYIFTFVIYLFIFKIVKLIYLDMKSITTGEDAKSLGPHLMLLSSEGGKSGVVTELYPLLKKQTTIGRSLECDIVLYDKHISSEHARIEKVKNRFIITDLNSINGTYVNNVKIQERTVLDSNDQISIGNMFLLFSEGGK